MKKTLLVFALLFVSALGSTNLYAQEKGVDSQNSSIRDAGSGRGAGNNGTKQDTGAGRGVNFGKGRTPAPVTVPNPYRLAARRDATLKAVQELLREKGIVVDVDVSRLNEGMVITQPFVFAKGSTITQSELERATELPATFGGRGWTRARHTLTIEIQPIDGTAVNLSVNAKIEGRSDGPTGAEWITLRSTGEIEQNIISQIVASITGASPSDPPPQP